jgi:hypothetical protein
MDNVTIDGAGVATYQVEHLRGRDRDIAPKSKTHAAHGSGSTLLLQALIDTSPPWTEALNVPETWTNLPPSISLTATDNAGGTGVASTWYWREGTLPALYTGSPISFTVSGDTNLHFYSVDAAGNVEPTQTVNVRTDFTEPETSSDTTANYLGASDIALTATDTFSGVGETRYWLDGLGRSSARTVTDVPGRMQPIEDVAQRRTTQE